MINIIQTLDVNFYWSIYMIWYKVYTSGKQNKKQK